MQQSLTCSGRKVLTLLKNTAIGKTDIVKAKALLEVSRTVTVVLQLPVPSLYTRKKTKKC
jgi:hypothetical protein